MGWVGKAYKGASGGSWTIWNTNKWKWVSTEGNSFSISKVLEEILGGRSFFVFECLWAD